MEYEQSNFNRSLQVFLLYDFKTVGMYNKIINFRFRAKRWMYWFHNDVKRYDNINIWW